MKSCSLFSDWEPAIRIGVLDCGEEDNYETCKEYGIYYYPTFRVSGTINPIRQLILIPVYEKYLFKA